MTQWALLRGRGPETEKELARGAAHRLAIIRHAQEVSGNVAKTCRYNGISRNAYYNWLRRFEEEGEPGLRDRSKRPLVMPRATHIEVVGKILYLRQCDRPRRDLFHQALGQGPAPKRRVWLAVR
jgi:transposase-like protein